MKFIKSHLRYSKSQRNGIFLLLSIVIVLQIFLWFVHANKQEQVEFSTISNHLQSELDSIASLDEVINTKINPFNPNYLSDYKAYQLGMTVEQIDRLMAFRSSGKYINSPADFKRVTQVSDSLLAVMLPYFKFPDWVTKKNVAVKTVKIVVKDINTATQEALVKVKGIGAQRASNIIQYRKLLGGYTYDEQLKEVWGIPKEVLKTLQKEFKVLSKPNIDQLNVNTATVNQLSKIVYINYALAKSIVAYRTEVAEIQDLEELKIIRDFPKDKFNLISLYLHAY
ncbi:ComEA family DNA-binding protein [Wenyingzhuangia fucanilytica]|uniref:ComEA family DNA-binding protein n=1 Tax=Wenyingzhuangia fucanilytica TaxID=1790137 RepID=UPI00083ACF46|nr:helix-hairpin-helix domain-containing protein [Wenyingzhuangia fucanilytica]